MCPRLLYLFLLTLATVLGHARAGPCTPLADDAGELLAAVLVLEAANQGTVGMEAVMSVIDNRAKGWPALYVDVVTRPYQFSALNRSIHDPSQLPRLIARAKQDRVWPVARAIVNAAVTGHLTDRTGGALFYADSRLRPRWLRDVRPTVLIGRHTFYVPRNH